MNKFFLFLSFSLFAFSLNAQSAKNISLQGHLTYNEELSDVWAYVDGNGHEYALVGVNNGVSIVDISTDPGSPTELHFVPGERSIWRDLKTFQDYAYITNETADGLLIIDLSALPGAISFKDTIMASVETAHNVWIDENGIMYLVGVNNSNGTGTYNGGMVMFDLNSDPWRPAFLGSYTERYVHDVYVRNNVAYTGEIDDGLLSIIDVSNKAAPVVLGSRSYANSFTHNTWLNDAGTVCFTTDELSDAYIYAWDVTDPTDIIELDKIRSSLSEGRATPHNVHVLNDYIVTSYYKDGINIIDANRPTNLVEVGYYDTSPMENGGTDGCWGAYPFLPSGLLLATDIEEGLFVFQANFTRAAYLEGIVTDAATTQALGGVLLLSAKTDLETSTDNMGGFATGTADPGSYTVEFVKYGFLPESRTVSLSSGNVTTENVALTVAPMVNYTYHVIDAGTKQPIPDARIRTFAVTDGISFDYQTNMTGTAVDATLFSGRYTVIAGKWGYITNDAAIQVDAINNSVTIELSAGYYDDFAFDYNWQIGGDAIGGIWERGIPNGTDLFGNVANPDMDMAGDFGDEAFVTGNMPGDFFEDDVDNGSTLLISPTMDLTSYTDPVLQYHWWLLNFDTNRFRDGDDTLRVFVNNNGQNIQVAKYGNTWRNRWNRQEPIYLNSFFTTYSSQVRVSFVIGDLNNQNILEGGIDGFMLTNGLFNVGVEKELQAQAEMHLFPNPVKDQLNLAYEIPSGPGRNLQIEIYTLEGRKLFEKELNGASGRIEMDFPFPAGLYLAILRQDGQILRSKKIVK